MNNQWPHCKDSASRNKAIDAGHLFCQPVDCIIAQYAHLMSPREHAQRSVVGYRVIQVDAESQHLSKGGCWCMRVYHAVID